MIWSQEMMDGFALASHLAEAGSLEKLGAGQRVTDHVAEGAGDLVKHSREAKPRLRAIVTAMRPRVSRLNLSESTPRVRYLLASSLGKEARQQVWNLLRDLPEPRRAFVVEPALRQAVLRSATAESEASRSARETQEIEQFEAKWRAS